jgi:hypothetical protein
MRWMMAADCELFGRRTSALLANCSRSDPLALNKGISYLLASACLTGTQRATFLHFSPSVTLRLISQYWYTDRVAIHASIYPSFSKYQGIFSRMRIVPSIHSPKSFSLHRHGTIAMRLSSLSFHSYHRLSTDIMVGPRNAR